MVFLENSAFMPWFIPVYVFIVQIAAEVCAPLAKTDEIVMLGDDRTTSETARLLSNLPPAVQALTGVDLSKVSPSPSKNKTNQNTSAQ